MSRTDASAPPLRREADRVDTSRLQVRTAQIRLRKGPTLAERSPIVPGWTFTGLHWSGRRARSTVHTPTTCHLAIFPLENSSSGPVRCETVDSPVANVCIVPPRWAHAALTMQQTIACTCTYTICLQPEFLLIEVL